MTPIPMTAADLIAELNKAYPAKPPSMTDNDRKVWWDAGQRALVDNLVLRLEKTNAAGRLLERN